MLTRLVNRFFGGKKFVRKPIRRKPGAARAGGVGEA
jgi:hypothetical protein